MQYFSSEEMEIGLRVDDNEYIIDCVDCGDGLWAITTGDAEAWDAMQPKPHVAPTTSEGIEYFTDNVPF
jgi:hypothetical protein